MVDRSIGRRVFRVVNAAVFVLYALLCLLPMIHVLSISLSSSVAVTAGEVKILPVEFTLKSYEFVMKKAEFWRAMQVSLERIVLGVSLSTMMTILAAYPLSKPKRDFRAQPVFIWIFVFTMLFSGGMIPSYMIVRYTGLIDKIWALVIPGVVQVFNIVLLMNYFRTIPKEIEEAAAIDGCGRLAFFWRIALRLSVPGLVTTGILAFIGSWNGYLLPLFILNDASLYTLPLGVQAFSSEHSVDTAAVLAFTSLSMLPALAFFSLFERRIVGGLTGAVKG